MIRTEILKSVRLFSELDDDELAAIARVVSPRHYDKDAVVFHEQDTGDVCFAIAEGKVKVSIVSPEGKELILSVLEKGDFFGEMALFDNSPRSATIVAIEPTELYAIRRSAFLAMLGENFSITRKLLVELSARLRRANLKIESLVHIDVNGRLARYLINLARTSGVPVAGGFVSVRRPTHQEIANTIGTARETVSRLFHDLVDRGVVLTEGRTVYIRESMLGDLDASD